MVVNEQRREEGVVSGGGRGVVVAVEVGDICCQRRYSI